MSQFYYGPGPQASMNSHTSFGPSANQHNNHRSRRSTRFSSSQHPQRHFNKQQRTQNQKETAEAAQAAAFRKDFEAARSFDLEDDEAFCPWHLLTEDDVCSSSVSQAGPMHVADHSKLQSIHSSSSDRSSSSGSGSPDNSPLQHQIQPTPNFAMPPTPQHNFQHTSVSSNHPRLHQPQAQRARNAIPIVDPNSRNTTPPTSISPARQTQKSWYGPRRQQW